MSRCKHITKREILPDEKYNHIIMSKFINILMTRGKKSVSRKIFYTTLDNLEKKTKKNPIEVFEKALDNVRPIVEVKSRRVGGATYQVPVEVSESRGIALAMRWIASYSRARNEKTMADKLTGELMDAYNQTGTTFKKREDTHKMAEANKAFSHFRW
ncbi:MAG: 30S ribosomal protein S7 [Spirochaetes bacterium]|nr:30S ribosomal protein S7 [Spirochaetota bacterium]